MKKLYFIGILCAFLFSVHAGHAQRNCGTMEYLQMQKEQDPQRAANLEAIDRFTAKVLSNPAKTVEGTIVIPVVVHVVYRTSNENISMSQVESQFDVLNRDFQRLNVDTSNVWPQAGNPRIQFCLASVDPQGNPTDGVTRTVTTKSSFSTNDNVKHSSNGGADAWPSNSYLNIWVCNLGGGLLGYAQFPGGPAATDGVVVDFEAFGTNGTADPPFNHGRSTTHEIGHYLNLHHIWGDVSGCGSDDGVTDTPVASGPHYGCQMGAVSCGSTDMVENFMDYSDDDCMNLFTENQNSRMRALFEPGGFRAGLLTSQGCAVTPYTCDDGIQNGQETGVDCGGPDCVPCSCDGTMVTLTITFDNYPEETRWALSGMGANYEGGPYITQADGSTLIYDFCLDIDNCYTFTIMDSYGDGMCCSHGEGSYVLVDNTTGTVLAEGGSFGEIENASFCLDDGTGECTGVDIDYTDFETSFGIWNDGGSDCLRYNTPYASDGSYLAVLRDNSSSSVLYTDPLDFSNIHNIAIAFSYITKGMDNSSEGFVLEYSIDGGATYTIEKAYYLHTDFQNLVQSFPSRDIPGPFSENTILRFRCEGSQNNDIVGIDQIQIIGCEYVSPRISNPTRLSAPDDAEASHTLKETLQLFPNPAGNTLNLRFESQTSAPVTLNIYTYTGVLVQARQIEPGSGLNQITWDVSGLAAGSYLFQCSQLDQSALKRFVIVK